VEPLLGDTSPLVRAMAVWALWHVAPGRASALRDGCEARESDDDVLREWTRGLTNQQSAD